MPVNNRCTGISCELWLVQGIYVQGAALALSRSVCKSRVACFSPLERKNGKCSLGPQLLNHMLDLMTVTSTAAHVVVVKNDALSWGFRRSRKAPRSSGIVYESVLDSLALVPPIAYPPKSDPTLNEGCGIPSLPGRAGPGIHTHP